MLAVGGAFASAKTHVAQIYYYTVASVCTATQPIDKNCQLGGTGCTFETSPGNFEQLYATAACSPSSSLQP